MGNSKSTGSFLEMKRLEEVTGIPRQKFIDMHEECKRKSGSEGNTVLVDRADCRHFINQAGVGANNQREVDAAFGFFENDGKMSTEELFSCAVILSETMDGAQRLAYVIDIHNPKGADQNAMLRKYGQKVLQCINEFFPIKKPEDPEQVWIKICGGTNAARVTREKFIAYLCSHDPYQDFLV
jgi:hypothetical protein